MSIMEVIHSRSPEHINGLHLDVLPLRGKVEYERLSSPSVSHRRGIHEKSRAVVLWEGFLRLTRHNDPESAYVVSTDLWSATFICRR